VITLTLLHPLKPIPVQVWTFQDHESVIRIGRSTDNNVILYSAVVSRYHVELRRTGSKWEVVNLGTNGTYIDGKRITQVPIIDGAIIRLARSGPNLQIRIGSEAIQNLPNLVNDRFTDQLPAALSTETEITTDHQIEGRDKMNPQGSQDSESGHEKAG
jgi:eukaryotic-like serine/threonine-protein kinase